MSENTEGQHPNPADGASATDAAKPNGLDGENATDTGGQGKGGEAGGDAGDQGKPEGGKDGEGAGDGQGKNEPDKPNEGAPEAYADFELPDGFALEGERKDAALALFRDLNLDQGHAQKAIDHFIKLVGEDDAMRKSAFEAAALQQRDEWAKQAKAELGERFDAEVAMARTAVQATQSEALKEAFEQHHWGNHPELIKAFAFFGKMMRDSSVDGIGDAGGAPAKAKPWDAMYGDSMK